MSVKVSKTSPLQSTRQMLDELDALMERMLALPVGDNEELAPLPRDVRPLSDETDKETRRQGDKETDSASPCLLVSLSPCPDLQEQEQASAGPLVEERQETGKPEPLGTTRSEDEEGDRFREAEESPSSSVTHHPPPATYSTAETELPTKARESLADAFEDQLSPPLAINRPVQYVTTPARPRAQRGNPLLAPLVWANQSFDLCTSWLGPLGRGLRSNRGRTLLGIVGLACLGAASAWAVLERVGWP